MKPSNGNLFRVTGPCAGNSSVTGEFPSQRPVTRSFDVFFDLRLNKRLSKQSWGWWFQTPSRLLWHHCNANAFISKALWINVAWLIISLHLSTVWYAWCSPITLFYKIKLAFADVILKIRWWVRTLAIQELANLFVFSLKQVPCAVLDVNKSTEIKYEYKYQYVYCLPKLFIYKGLRCQAFHCLKHCVDTHCSKR